MNKETAKQLHNGDEVFWNDPDGQCSRVLTIADIEIIGDFARIRDVNGDVLECFISELS